MTPQQKKLHDFLWSRRGGVMPSYSEMAAHMGFASKGSVHRVIDALVEMKLVKRSDDVRARRLTIMPAPGGLSDVSTEELLLEVARRGLSIDRFGDNTLRAFKDAQ